MSVLRPKPDRQGNGQHDQTNDDNSRNGNDEIAKEPADDAEIPAPERITPLQIEQCEKNAPEQRAPEIVPQRNSIRWPHNESERTINTRNQSVGAGIGDEIVTFVILAPAL